MNHADKGLVVILTILLLIVLVMCGFKSYNRAQILNDHLSKGCQICIHDKVVK